MVAKRGPRRPAASIGPVDVTERAYDVAVGRLTEVQVPTADLSRLQPLIGDARFTDLEAAAQRTRSLLEGTIVWNVNSTSEGGGVAEMLQVLLGYIRGMGVDARWAVLAGDARFFAITKRLHNRLHGVEGDDGDLGPVERQHYREVVEANAAQLRRRVRPGDVVLLHDPQTAGLVPPLTSLGANVIWRCHIGSDSTNRHTEAAWAFLRPDLEACRSFVFSLRSYAPAWIDPALVAVIPPSIDPFSPKNQPLDDGARRRILRHVGIGDDHGTEGNADADDFTRRGGAPGKVARMATVLCEGGNLQDRAPLVIQVSRWDHLKDMQGVLEGFARYVAPRTDSHLALVGPAVEGVFDDPEGAAVLQQCTDAWHALPAPTRRRIRLIVLPMHDVDENAAMVNALQRHATLVVQKSLAEGFGITVAEAMWKGRPMVASAVGGIRGQVEPGTGVLLDDPTDLETFGEVVTDLLSRPDDLAAMGQRARQHVLERFVGDQHLIRYAELIGRLTAAPAAAATNATASERE
jgi:trehalose synthase